MEFHLPQDFSGNAAQALCPDPDAIKNLSIVASSVNIALATGTVALRLYTNASCWYTFGGSGGVSVTGSNGVFLPVGAVEEPISVRGLTHIAVIRDTADGNLNIVKLV